MKDDNMQNFNNPAEGKSPFEPDDKSFFDSVSRNSDAQIDKILKETSARSREEKVRNFSVHIDDVSDIVGSDKPAADKPEPEESKDIFSFSDDSVKHSRPPRTAPAESMIRRDIPGEPGGVDISAPAARRPVQPRPVFEEEPQEEAEPQKWPGKKSPHKKGGGCLRGVVVATVVLVCSVFLSWYIISCVNDLLGLMKTDETVEVSIPEGATTGDVAKLLKSKGLIDQELFFTIFTDFRYDYDDPKYPGYIAGDYELHAKMGYEGIVNKIKYPVETDKTVMVTFPEGLSLTDIAKKLEENKVCSAADFLKAVNEETFDYKLIKSIPKDDRFFKLEGYVFPDTYEFYVDESPKSVVDRFVKNAQMRIGNDLLGRANELGMTMDEVLTLASIIQKEASDPNEMGKVSSVFHNRLNKSGTFPLLQSDPTINYVENCIVPNLTDPSQKEKYAQLYNTYKCTGLPVAPICSPVSRLSAPRFTPRKQAITSSLPIKTTSITMRAQTASTRQTSPKPTR